MCTELILVVICYLVSKFHSKILKTKEAKVATRYLPFKHHNDAMRDAAVDDLTELNHPSAMYHRDIFQQQNIQWK